MIFSWLMRIVVDTRALRSYTKRRGWPRRRGLPPERR